MYDACKCLNLKNCIFFNGKETTQYLWNVVGNLCQLSLAVCVCILFIKLCTFVLLMLFYNFFLKFSHFKNNTIILLTFFSM